MAPLDFDAPAKEEKAEIRPRKAAITRRVKREVMAEFEIDKLPRRGDRKLITGGQGTGKSRTVAETIAELLAGTAIWWLVPILAKAEEQLAEYERLAGPESMSARIVRGRGAADPARDGEPMCPRHLVVNRAAGMGVNVQEDICDGGCPLQSSCGYQAQKRAIEAHPSGLFVMAADYLWLPCHAPHPDLVVVDESVIGKAAENVSFDPSRIVEDQKWVGGDIAEAVDRREIALLVHSAITQHPGRELAFLRDNGVTAAEIGSCIEHVSNQQEAPLGLHGSMSDGTIANVLDAVEAREILQVLKLFLQIRCELNQPRERLNSIWFDPNATVRVQGQLERQPRVFVSCLKRLVFRAAVPVIALDGTGSLELNRRVFGDRMTAERFAVPRDADVVQVSSKTFSRQSITGTDCHGNPRSARNIAEAARLRQQVLELLSLLPGQVLLVTYKAAEEILLDDLPEYVVSTHFGGLRGLNRFETCETAVVMGREQPSAQAIELLTRPFTAADAEPFLPAGEYVVQARGRRMRNEGPNVVEVQVHPDPRCQEVLEQVREAEIVQAVDRVRPVFNRRKIFVLNNLPLDLTVDHARPWPALRPGKFVHAFARHGVLPLSAGDLSKAFPDLWPTESGAAKALERAKKTPDTSQIEYLFGVCRVFLPDILRATYRRRGQRGPLARALVRADLVNPRAVLEGLVGEVVKFHVERGPDRSRESANPHEPARPRPLPRLPPLAATLSAEAQFLAKLPPAVRPPDMLGMARVLRLMGLTGNLGRAERMAAA
jgi:hypothetical protein